MGKIRVAIVGVGNCASSLVQLVHASAGKGKEVTGVMHQTIGGYNIEDVQFVAAFDINSTKIEMDLAEAIYAYPNCTTQYYSVPPTGVRVSRGLFKDGIGENLKDVIDIDPECHSVTVDQIAQQLLRSEADVVVNYLPVGSNEDTKAYALAAIKAKCAFVNCNPELLATEPEWEAKFRAAGLPILGDDIKSQLGATMLHRSICQQLLDRGANIMKTYQLNVGGNTDFQNMVDRSRSKTKKFTKTNAMVDVLGKNSEVNVGPSDHIPMLKDRKVAYIRIEGDACLGMSFSVEVRLDVEDSPNSAGVAIDAIRCAKYALDRKLCGAVPEPSAFLFKHPPVPFPEREIKDRIDEWVM